VDILEIKVVSLLGRLADATAVVRGERGTIVRQP
jgi:hypothetical protein